MPGEVCTSISEALVIAFAAQTGILDANSISVPACCPVATLSQEQSSPTQTSLRTSASQAKSFHGQDQPLKQVTAANVAVAASHARAQ